jgi:hypothetical protein
LYSFCELYGNSRSYFVNCIFSHFYFNFTQSSYVGGMFYITYSSRPNFISCKFDDINCTGSYPVMFYSDLTYSVHTINITNTTYQNINHSGSSSLFGLFLQSPSLRLTAIGSSFVNITGTQGFKGGVFYIDNQSNITFNLSLCNFTNIQNGGDGGVIYSNTGTSYTLTSCVFEQCSSTGGSGGAIYINNTGIFTYISCRFLNNSANSGGNDIHHSSNLVSSYSSSQFVQTCSSSSSSRVAFPNNVNVDSLLLGLKMCYFCFYFILFIYLFVLIRMCSSSVLCSHEWF